MRESALTPLLQHQLIHLVHSLQMPSLLPVSTVTRTLTHTHTHSHSLTRTLTHSPTHSLTHLLTHSLTYSLTHSPTHSLTHLLTHSLTYSLTHTHTHSLTEGADTTAVSSSGFDPFNAFRPPPPTVSTTTPSSSAATGGSDFASFPAFTAASSEQLLPSPSHTHTHTHPLSLPQVTHSLALTHLGLIHSVLLHQQLPQIKPLQLQWCVCVSVCLSVSYYSSSLPF